MSNVIAIESACARIDEVSAELSLCVNMQQVGPEEWDYASAIDARTGQMVSELTAATGAIRVNLAAPSAASAGLPMDDNSRHARFGAHVFEFAKEYGWKDDGEGAFEYIQRHSYIVGFEDAGGKVGAGGTQTFGNRWPISVLESDRAIAATSPKCELTNAQIHDMIFGYAPSCKIGEGRELARAIAAASGPNAALVEMLDKVMRPYGIYDVAAFHAGALQEEFMEIGRQIRAVLAAAGIKDRP